MVNNYIKELTQNALITVSGKSNRTRAYHLTEKGKEFLSRHFLAFSTETVQLYASVKHEITSILQEFYNDGIRTVVLFGASDTAEIVHTALQDTRLVVIGVVDSDPVKQGKLFNGNIIQSPGNICTISPDAVLITSFARQTEIRKDLEFLSDHNIKIKIKNLARL